MFTNTSLAASTLEIDKNFSKIAETVEKTGVAVMTKNHKPQFMVISFDEYSEIQKAKQRLFSDAADSVISENMDALLELAK